MNLPTDHPLYEAGAEVWKIVVPATATSGATGKIKANLTIDGVEQTYESPRSITIIGPSVKYTRFAQGASGYPSPALASQEEHKAGYGSCQQVLNGGFPAQQVYHTFWVERLELPDGPNGPETYQSLELAGCSFSGTTSVSVRNLGIPRRTNPGLGQATIELAFMNEDASTDWEVKSGNISYHEYAPRRDAPGTCDVRTFTAKVYATFAGGAPVFRSGWDGTVSELAPTVSSCDDGLITRLKSIPKITTN